MASKRLDLQSLRAWAVLAVVVFHFFPSIIPFGYLGVDIFFVLSGFLITHVLSGNDAFSYSTYGNFYFKRVRRIFPLLLVLVLFLLIHICSRYVDQLLFYATKSATFALIFASNLKGEDQGEDYFRQLEKAQDLFTHTWSLSVEIQFYYLAPFLILLGKRLTGRFSLHFFSVVASTSLIYHCTLPPSASFNSTFSRLWQFLLGTIAHELQDAERSFLKEDPNQPRMKKDFIMYLSGPSCQHMMSTASRMKGKRTVVVELTQGIQMIVARVLVTIVAATIVQQCFQSPLLCHPSLVAIGDLSYSLYLIHWPVYCWMIDNQLDSAPDRILGIFVCIIASYICYEFYEKWYLTFTVNGTALFLWVLYTSNFVLLILTPKTFIAEEISTFFSGSNGAVDLLSADFHEDPSQLLFHGNRIERMLQQWEMENSRNISLDESLRISDEFEKKWDKLLMIPNCTMLNNGDTNPFGLCEAPKGNGKLKILVLGNSYTASLARLHMGHLRDHYSTMHFHAQYVCEFLFQSIEPYCKDSHAQRWQSIDTVKPDVVIVIQRLIGSFEVNPKVFILQALPRLRDSKSAIRNRIEQKKPLDDVMAEIIEVQADNLKSRLTQLAKECKKCALIDVYNRHLNKEKKFTLIHPHTHIQYFDHCLHYTPYGWRLIAPVFEKLNQNFNQLISSKNYPDNVLEW